MERRGARWQTWRIVRQAEKLGCLKDAERRGKGESNYKCGRLSKDGGVRERDSVRHK